MNPFLSGGASVCTLHGQLIVILDDRYSPADISVDINQSAISISI